MANPEVATEKDDAPLQARLRRINTIAGLCAALWLAVAVIGTPLVSHRVLSQEVARAAEDATRDTQALTGVIDRMFYELTAIPQVLSTGRDLMATVARYNKQEGQFSHLAAERRREILAADATVVRLSTRFTRIRDALKYDLLYVLDKNGIRLVTSDWDRESSLLGTDLGDREYFHEAMAGQTGHMFGYSRVARIPAFFFSSPVDDGSGPIGAVVARQTSQAIGSFLAGGRHTSMIVDAAGMIIASSDPKLYMRHLGAFAKAHPDEDKLHALYAQERVRDLDATVPPRRLHEAEWLIGGRPFLVTRGKLTSAPYDIYVLAPIDWTEEVAWLHRLVGALVLLSGFVILLLLNRRFASLERRRHYTRVTSALNDKLAAANKEKDRYLGIAAHDLRNPLSSTRGLAELMMESELEPEQQREFLETIHRTSDEMLVMVNDLLDVAVIESGRLDLRFKEVDIARLVKQRIRHQEPSARAKKIGLDLEAPEKLVASIDSARFSQVVDNLVSNAIKFSPPGTTVAVALRAEGESFVLDVRDQGPGMSEDDRKLLFRSFQKLSARPTGGEKSTGLGLAIVKKIVDAHHGRIEVDSAPGRGSRFTVTTPMSAAQEVHS